METTANGFPGISQIADLTFGGAAVTVTGQANQTVEIPGVATLVINEQVITSHPRSQTIRVNALHLKLVTGEEVILSSATSTINW